MPSPSSVWIHGKNGRVIIGTSPGAAIIVDLQEWSAQDAGEFDDATSFEAGGFAVGLHGNDELTVRFRGFWSVTVNPLVDPPGIYPRDDLEAVGLYLVKTNGTLLRYYLPWARVMSGTTATNVKQGIRFDGEIRSNGLYYRPGQAIVP